MTETETICPKCDARSGDDWSQCLGHCPMLGSPYFDAEWVIGDREEEDDEG